MAKLRACLVLGCNGHTGKDGFIDCLGVSNPIIHLEELDDGVYQRFIDFLEHTCEFFDRPMYNHNKISNTLNMIHRDYEVMPHVTLFNVQRFLKMHRQCGSFLIIFLEEDYYNE